MKLNKKKELAARALNVGKNKIVFNPANLEEIKEMLTRNDVKELQARGAILVKSKIGRRKKHKRKTRRRYGSVKVKVKQKKRSYIITTRKLRSYLKNLKNKNKISRELYLKIRKEIRQSKFKNLQRLKERIEEEINKKEKENEN